MTDRRLSKLLPVPRWPTAEEAHAARWFQPVTLGPVTAQTRTWVPAMVPWRATNDGLVTPEVLAWYRRFAQGRPGVIVVEATGVRDVASGPLLRASHERYVPGLKHLADAVHDASGGATRIFIQLIDFLAIKRRPTKEKYFGAHLALTESHRAAFPGVSDGALRARLTESDDEALRRVLTPREFDAYAMGF
ncbi:MAG: NADH:flavin oxidoreductase, partial [Archangium sp.]|nr:NADH:flavin oxidoreductase [Archangium sp.]